MLLAFVDYLQSSKVLFFVKATTRSIYFGKEKFMGPLLEISDLYRIKVK